MNNLEYKSMSDEELNKVFEELPVGYISKKVINGRTYYYYQWRDGDRVKSKYVKSGDVEKLSKNIELRRHIQKILHDRKCANRLHTYLTKINDKYLSDTQVHVGEQDFRDLISDKGFYIDKTQFIEEWWTRGDEVTLITRPRRFGKTLNLSMLYYFFNNTEDAKGIFNDLYICKCNDVMAHQGKYPVIYVSFAGVKGADYETAMHDYELIFSGLFQKFEYLLIADIISANELEYFHKIINCCDENRGVEAIGRLSSMLYRYHKQKVIVLIDEYDTPMIEAATNDYWSEISSYTRKLFGTALKNNEYMIRACMTGITRVARESLFSDMNNAVIASVTANMYTKCFGFTQDEVRAALNARSVNEMELVKSWYDGFYIGDESDIYNPWSITCFLDSRQLRSYWVNTSDNALVSTVFLNSRMNVKDDLCKLIAGESITKTVSEEISFDNLFDDEESLWGLLLSSGYLKAQNVKIAGKIECNLSITNKETLEMFRSMVRKWFRNGDSIISEFSKALLDGDVAYIQYYLEDLLMDSVSCFDIGKGDFRTLENFYHGLMLGLVSQLSDRFHIRSNRESGLGRYDIMMEPVNNKGRAFILEFKVFDSRTERELSDTAMRALNQIEEKSYATELLSRGISSENILKYGFAFKKKECLVMLKE